MKSKIVNGLKRPDKAIKYLYKSRTARLTALSHIDVGTNVFDLEWDLLIILDSCRVDALKEVAPEYDFLDRHSIDTMISVGSSTLEWSTATFTNSYKDDISNTAMVSGNPWPYRITEEGYTISDRAVMKWDTVSQGTVGLHERAWKRSKREIDDRPYGDSSVVTDLAIQIGREEDFDRVIAHYIEPHYPYVQAARKRGSDKLDPTEKKPWEYLRNGGDRDAVWENYLTELRHGLDEVESLLKNFNAESVIISADHGDSFGELWTYGHPTGSLHPKVRRVPVFETSSTDNFTRFVDIPEIDETIDAKDRLKHLGYL